MNSTNFYAVSAFSNGLFGLFIVYYIYLRNKQNPVNQSFLCFGIAVTGWSLIYSLWAWAGDARWAEFYLRRHMMFEAFIPAGFFYFLVHFTGNYERLKKFVWFFYGLGAFYSAAMLTPFMISGVKNVLIFKFWPQPGPWLLSHVVYFFVVMIWAFALLIRHCFVTSGMDRKRALLVLAAFLIGFGGGSTNWFLWFDISIPPATNFFVGLMFAVVGYAIVRYGLMDADMFVELLRASRAASLGVIASSMNHELRNPLYIAKGKIETHLDAIERGIVPSFEEESRRSREVAACALHQLTRAMDIMQKFSDFVRPKPRQLEKENIPVREAVQEVLGLISKEFEFRKIRVDDAPLNGAVIYANRRQFEEILFNLMVNACQAIENNLSSPNALVGNVIARRPEADEAILGLITISAKHERHRVTIEIADTGPGIPKADLQKVFEPFYSTKAEKGTGLGLYIVKQLVERNGGKISVKSQLGKGTTFRLELSA